MAGALEEVRLELGQVICQAGETASHVYFPGDSLISLIAVASGGKSLEVGLIGRQGMLGVSLALGAAKSPSRALVQGTGSAWRMTARDFLSELRSNEPLRAAAARYAHLSMATAMQIAACNNAHVIHERLARWILMTADALTHNSFRLTHGLLAIMLGVQRSGVSTAAASLQKRGLIRYRRGQILVLNRAGLREVSCGCYDLIRQIEA